MFTIMVIRTAIAEHENATSTLQRTCMLTSYGQGKNRSENSMPLMPETYLAVSVRRFLCIFRKDVFTTTVVRPT